MATGRTKDLPGFDRLTGFVVFTADLPVRVRKRPEEPWLGALAPEPAPAGTDEYAEEADHVPGDALLEHRRFPS